jgi:hypothetical protein
MDLGGAMSTFGHEALAGYVVGGGLYNLNPVVVHHSLNAPGFKALKLKCDMMVSSFAFKFQLVPLHLGS